MLHIHLLGNPQAFDGDEPLPRPTPARVVVLWAYLLLNCRQAVARDHLAYTLWPDATETEARANLRRHLHLLRKQLPPSPLDTPWILATRRTVQWNPDAPCQLDVAFLEDFEAETADETQWAALLAGYGGDLLTGLYDDWVLVERERLHQRFLRLCEMRLAQQWASGDLSGALVTARRLLAHDPLREEPYRRLMELHYRLGDRAAALRAFEQCEAMLRTELEVQPMPETLALRDAILQDQVANACAGPQSGASTPRRGLWSARSVESVPAQSIESVPAQSIESVPAQSIESVPAQSIESVPAQSMGEVEQRPAPPQSRRRWLGLVASVILALALGAVIAIAVLHLLDREPERISISGPEAVQDTWLNFLYPDLPYDPEWSQDPYAVYPQVHLSYWGYPYDRVLLRFDLDALPASAEVQQATLHLHLEPFLNKDLTEPRPATVSAFRVLTDWQPETATFDAPWSQPGLAPGVDFDARALDDDSLRSSDWIDLDVTEAVQDWLAHPTRNFGLVVMITAAPQGAHYWVDTTNYPLPDRQPHLEITYKP